MRIAIVGAGIAGNVAASLLHPRHEVTVFEAAGHIGGHSHTHEVRQGGRTYHVDTGFIVFNEKNYPQLSAMFRHLNVPTHKSDMTFAASIRLRRSSTAVALASRSCLVTRCDANRSSFIRPSSKAISASRVSGS